MDGYNKDNGNVSENKESVQENSVSAPKNGENRENTENTGKNNPFSVYAVVSQIGFMVVIPLLVFIWGGSWLIGHFSLPQWLMAVFIALGIVTMISSVGSYLMKLTKKYGKSEVPKVSELHHDTRDHDYYDE